MRKFLISILFLALSISSAAIPVAQATDCEPHIVNFDDGESYSIELGSIGEGRTGSGAVGEQTNDNTRQITVTVPVSTGISSISWYGKSTHGGAVYEATAILNIDDETIDIVDGGLTADGDWHLVSYEVPAEYQLSVSSFQVHLDWSTGGTGEIYIDDISYDSACDVLVRPLASVDENTNYGLFDNQQSFDEVIADPFSGQFYPLLGYFSPYAVVDISNAPGLPVHAGAAGTVTLQPLTRDDCGDGQALSEPNWENSTTFLPVFGYQACLIAFFSYNGNKVTGDVLPDNLYIVTIQATEEYLIYVVANAPDYVTDGDTVSGGCVIGETIAIEASGGITTYVNLPVAPIGTEILHVFQAQDIHVGFTVVSGIIDLGTHEPDTDFLTKLVDYPSDDHPCNFSPTFQDCMGSNPRFLRDGDGWLTKGHTGVYFSVGGGATINPGSELYTSMSLDSESTYTVTVGGIDLFGALSTALVVRIGTTTETFSLDGTQERVALEEATPTGPVADGVYEIGLKNTGSAPIYVDFACVTEGAPPLVPSVCYFLNNSFDYADAGWTTGTVISFDTGAVNMRDDPDSTLAQGYNLEAGDYTLSARVRAYYSTETELPTSPEADIDLLYDMGSGDSTLGSLIFTAFDPGWQVLSTTFNLASPATGTITFSLDINSGSSELLGLTIDRFCLEKDGGYTPPTTGYPPPLQASCEIIPSPQTNDVATWINWHWAHLNQFFSCTLMRLLNQWYLAVVNGINTSLKFFRFQIISVQYSANWVGREVIPWLGGYLSNIALGRTTIIQQGDTQCNDLFCLLTTIVTDVLHPIIDLVTTIVNTLLTYLNLALSLLLSALQLLLTFFNFIFSQFIAFVNLLISTLNSVITAFNSATPTAIPGLPTCQLDPQTDFFCITMWGAENTIFSGRGALIIPLLIGIFSIHLLLWTVETIQNELRKAASAI